MLTVVDYVPEHFDQLRLRGCHLTEQISRPENVHAHTFFLNGLPIAIVGSIEFMPGVLLSWGLLSDYVKECPFAFTKGVKRLIEHRLATGIRRVQFTVRQDYTEGWRWAKTLGFNCEGIMRKYGPDETDYALFARTT